MDARPRAGSATSGPMPMPTALIAWMHISAWREAAVELAVPLHVATEAGRHAGDDHLERAAERVAGLLRARRSPRSSAAGASASTQRSGASSASACASSNVTARSAGSTTSPIAETWLASRMPNRPSSCRARLPAATRAAVSRALARSSTSRMSSWPYLIAPARSAWPGRGRVTSARLAPVGALRHLRLGVHRLLPVDPVAVAE